MPRRHVALSLYSNHLKLCMLVHLQEEYEFVTMLLEHVQTRLAGAATCSIEEIQQMTDDLLFNESEQACDFKPF